MKLELKGNIKVNVVKLHQWRTYYGRMEGAPTKKSNRRLVKSVIEEAQKICHLHKYWLIVPEQTPIEMDRPYFFGTPMRLPPITCVAELLHHNPARNPEMHASSLLLIWFQEKYCFPISDEILWKLKDVDWKKHAFDFEY